MDPLYQQAILQGVVGLAFFLALIFGTAGTWDYWQGWVFLAVFTSATTAFTVYLAIYDKPLLERRLKAGLHRSSHTRLPVSPLTGAGLGLDRRRRDHRVLVPRHLVGHQDQQLGGRECPRGGRSGARGPQRRLPDGRRRPGTGGPGPARRQGDAARREGAGRRRPEGIRHDHDRDARLCRARGPEDLQPAPARPREGRRQPGRSLQHAGVRAQQVGAVPGRAAAARGGGLGGRFAGRDPGAGPRGFPLAEHDHESRFRRLGGAARLEVLDGVGQGLRSDDRDLGQGQEPQRGGWVWARHGKGHYTYFAYALHRQLPYGVPGAYRLLANLLSLNKPRLDFQ